MINAKMAREITDIAQAEYDAHARACIIREANDACEVIARAARCKNSSCHIDATHMDYPNDVAEYLKNKLGYTVSYFNNTISVSW